MFEDGFSHLPGGVFGSIEIKIDSLSAESNSWEDKVNFTADSNEDAYKRHTAVVMSSITVFVLFEAVSISRLFSAGGQNVTMPICSLVSPPNGMGVYFGSFGEFVDNGRSNTQRFQYLFEFNSMLPSSSRISALLYTFCFDH